MLVLHGIFLRIEVHRTLERLHSCEFVYLPQTHFWMLDIRTYYIGDTNKKLKRHSFSFSLPFKPQRSQVLFIYTLLLE